ncbi:hypothetical protein [Legionella cincinnatiensis]|uniref:Uncharacterized protein n=1 Tax=Legionella cincinnatiensis TaxID=28085 RepID=A0A378IIJ1_9GAMM|nr:hypothetical protein [Legionella cincinnatiensis]KTC91772.1 hypothetical protein Lcin_1172 [Legionella cincinnatiensis]STX34525.1 Uncharacterised protein [Legionella cincinnatiensis]
MISFFLKSGCNIIQIATKRSLIDATRSVSTTGIMFGGYYIYNKTASLFTHHYFFKNNSNKIDIKEVREYENKSSFSGS